MRLQNRYEVSLWKHVLLYFVDALYILYIPDQSLGRGFWLIINVIGFTDTELSSTYCIYIFAHTFGPL
jgi:hypothetical protein